MVLGNKGILNFNSCRIRYDPMLKLTSVSFPWKILPNFYDLIFQRGIIFTKILSITVSRVITISLVSQRLSEQFYLPCKWFDHLQRDFLIKKFCSKSFSHLWEPLALQLIFSKFSLNDFYYYNFIVCINSKINC